jgi:hypothetical protein
LENTKSALTQQNDMPPENHHVLPTPEPTPDPSNYNNRIDTYTQEEEKASTTKQLQIQREVLVKRFLLELVKMVQQSILQIFSQGLEQHVAPNLRDIAKEIKFLMRLKPLRHRLHDSRIGFFLILIFCYLAGSRMVSKLPSTLFHSQNVRGFLGLGGYVGWQSDGSP